MKTPTNTSQMLHKWQMSGYVSRERAMRRRHSCTPTFRFYFIFHHHYCRRKCNLCQLVANKRIPKLSNYFCRRSSSVYFGNDKVTIFWWGTDFLFLQPADSRLLNLSACGKQVFVLARKQHRLTNRGIWYDLWKLVDIQGLFLSVKLLIDLMWFLRWKY